MVISRALALPQMQLRCYLSYVISTATCISPQNNNLKTLFTPAESFSDKQTTMQVASNRNSLSICKKKEEKMVTSHFM